MAKADAQSVDTATRIRRAALWVVVSLVLAFLILPNLIVIPISFSSTSLMTFPPKGFSLTWYQQYLELPGWLAATRTSLIVATLTAVISTAFGSIAAYGLVRGSFPGKQLINSLILLPLIIPTLITAVAIFKLYTYLHLTGTIFGFVLADCVLAAPFVVTVVAASIRGIDPDLERAARTLGASRLTAIRRVTLPLALPGVISAALFAFLVSFDELMISIFISSPTVSTLPKALWEGIRLEITPVIAAVSTLLVALSLIVLGAVAVSQKLLSRGRS